MDTFPMVTCPLCKAPAAGTVDTIPGLAQLDAIDGKLRYSGQTDVEWNGQKTQKDDRGLTIFFCRACGQDFGAHIEDLRGSCEGCGEHRVEVAEPQEQLEMFKHVCADVGCVGAFTNVETLAIEHCDQCKKFETDEDAAAMVDCLLEVLQAMLKRMPGKSVAEAFDELENRVLGGRAKEMEGDWHCGSEECHYKHVLLPNDYDYCPYCGEQGFEG
jgi:hypothetical protein